MNLDTLLTILVAVLVFGFLIFIHEFGHYIFARIFHVSIKEFSIGMGPRLLWYDSKKTGIRYSLAIFPIGGFVAMVGEDEESNDPNALDKKPAWQRFIITAAGAAVNIIAGVLAVLILTSCINLGSTTIHSYFTEEEMAEYGFTFDVSSADSGLRPGDTITRIGKKRVKIADELAYEIMRQGNDPVDITVIRDGEEVLVPSVVFPKETAEGQTFGSYDFRVYAMEKTVGGVFRYAMRKSVLIVRMVWESLYDLIRGRYTLQAVSGPVGISGAIGTAMKSGALDVLNLVALISINLGVMNLLPIPALDGGRLAFLIGEMLTKKRVPAKVEALVNGIGLIVLLLLSVVIMIKDVIGLII